MAGSEFEIVLPALDGASAQITAAPAPSAAATTARDRLVKPVSLESVLIALDLLR